MRYRVLKVDRYLIGRPQGGGQAGIRRIEVSEDDAPEPFIVSGEQMAD